MSMVSGITFNSNVCLVARTHSLITRICRSILGTSSFVEVVLREIPADANSSSEDAIFHWRFETRCKCRIISLIPGITWFRNHTWSKLKSTHQSYSTHEQIRAAAPLNLSFRVWGRCVPGCYCCPYISYPNNTWQFQIVPAIYLNLL